MGRAIDEDGVIALINAKVNAAQDKIDRWNVEFERLTKEQRFTANDPVAMPLARRIADMSARVSAMNAVKMHLKLIEDYKPSPASEPVAIEAEIEQSVQRSE